MWLYARKLDNRRLLGRYKAAFWHPAPTPLIRREYGLRWMVSFTIIKSKSMSESVVRITDDPLHRYPEGSSSTGSFVIWIIKYLTIDV